ncbi:hypothetical protein UFOVP9_32 [uncultured Caudovirales phage]|uniref:Uncharacterized protein n=1 Tax=uncultured Caudovirales phage TaxID=2100421 RepID=A0A6J5KJ99_9CAUD|nr:hypothetical protein UFOVP9_32 [uncultured Caudovirales phage]
MDIKQLTDNVKQQWLMSSDGKSWSNLKKAQHADWSLNENKKSYGNKETTQKISINEGKISNSVLQERIEMCMHTEDIDKRLRMLEKLRTQVQLASIPYIDIQIKKVHAKMTARDAGLDWRGVYK